MEALDIRLNIDAAPWADMLEEPSEYNPDHHGGTLTHYAVLPFGTVGGMPSIALRGKLNDGTEVILQTTWALLYGAVRATIARYGEPK